MKEKRLSKLVLVSVSFAAVSFVFLTRFKNGQLFNTPAYDIIESVILSLWFVGNFYLFYDYLVPQFLDKNRSSLFIALSIAFLLGSPLLISIALKIFKTIFSIPSSGKITLWGFLGGAFGALITGGTGMSFRILINRYKDKQKNKELEIKNLESELKLLKARLNPHFLFNTINNIDTLIIDNPEKASEFLSKLSDLLRYVIYDTENEETEISDEIDIIEKYIELQTIRISNPVNVHKIISCDNQQLKIPPMLFLPFIENAFKHSDLNKPDHGVSIELVCSKKSIKFTCKNHFTNEKKAEGLGLELIRRRLELYYPDLFELEIKVIGNIFGVNLLINLNEN